MPPDLNDMIIFVKVVERGSFTAAARALNLPKTTVSRKVRDLEDRLGARLLNRTTRRLALTEAGTVYYEHSRDIAKDIDAAEEAVHELEGRPRGWLRVTAPHAFGVVVLTPILLEFQRRYPDVHIDLVLSNECLDLLAEEIDVAIRYGDLADSSMVARRLATYPSRIYASRSYLARHGEPRDPEDLRDHLAVVNTGQRRGRRFLWSLKAGSTQGDFEVNPVFVANDPWPLLQMMSGGQGLMLTTPAVAICSDHPADIRPVLDAWAGPEVQLNALFPSGHRLSPKVRVFVDFVAEQIGLIDPVTRMTALESGSRGSSAISAEAGHGIRTGISHSGQAERS